MVLYIFHVNTGAMMTFEMELALQTVQNLKETIERLHCIPATNQVLLISGGEVLDVMSRVCSYSSGTDENPIYLFTTMFDSPLRSPPLESHIHYEDEVNRSLAMPAEYNTVVVRAKLAHKMFESATKEIKVCEKLVFEQHLQQQGWAAVMANLEDLSNEFKHRSRDFLNTINGYVDERPSYLEYLKAFPSDLNKLSTVPILSELLPNAQHDFHGFDDYFMDTVSYTGSTSADSGTSVGGSSSNSRNRESLIQTIDSGSVADSSSQKNLTGSDKSQTTKVVDSAEPMTVETPPPSRGATLLQWISSRENHKSLRDMAEDCSRVLLNFDEACIDKIKGGIERTREIAEQESVKEVRGLTKRLEQLDTLMCDAKKIVQEQKELSTAFQQNQSRANNLGDASILPDLCMSHSNQMTVMLQNQNNLLDIEKRIMKAKEELGDNLNKRLRYVVHIQNSISELDTKLLFHHRCFRRLKHHLVIIKQIHEAPFMYVTAVTEVVRRRVYSEAMLKWAAELSAHLLTIHEEEKKRRVAFENAFDEHFLNVLFTGLDDKPPAFATKAPNPFDERLPKLSRGDLKMLAEAIPDIPTDIELPNLKTALSFFTNQLTIGEPKDGSDDIKAYTNKLLDIRAKDGCESETDTEEFEKVGQSPIDRRKLSTMSVPKCIEMATSTEQIETATTETLTEENAESTQDEINRLKALILSMGQLARNSISLLREQLHAIKDKADCDKTIELRKVEEAWIKLKELHECNERELIHRLTVDHELELTDVRKILSIKTNEIDDLKAENSKLLRRLADSKLDAETSKTRSSDQIDVLRDRVGELEAIVKNNESDKTKAVNELKDRLIREHKTELESLRCRYKLMKNVDRMPSDTSLEKVERPDYGQLQDGSPSSSQGLYRRILEEKERLLDTANTQVDLLTKENDRLKQVVQSLSDGDSHDSHLKEQLEALQKEKLKLRQKLTYERSRRAEASASKMETSGASSHRTRSSSKTFIQFDSCEYNDNVLVVWDEELYRYTIAQNSPYQFFMAEDSYPLFNLPVPSSRDVTFEHTNKPPYILATVVDKHFCMVKREGSRYRVPNGTKFFRVAVKPLSALNPRTPKTDADKVRKELADAQKPNFCRSLSIQLIDSFAQTEGGAQATGAVGQTPADSDAVDGGIGGIGLLQASALGQTETTFTSEEDVTLIGEAAALNIPSSQEEATVEMPATSDCDSDDFRSLDAAPTS